MKATKGFILLLILCFGMMSGSLLPVSALANSSDNPDEETVIYPTITVGNEVVVDLPSNPSTGFHWSFTSDEHMEFLKHEFEYQGKEGEIGAGGIDHWHFSALSSGTATLVFTYTRPWSGPAAKIKTVIIPIKSQD